MSTSTAAALVVVVGLSHQWLLRQSGTIATGVLAVKQEACQDSGGNQPQCQGQSLSTNSRYAKLQAMQHLHKISKDVLEFSGYKDGKGNCMWERVEIETLYAGETPRINFL